MKKLWTVKGTLEFQFWGTEEAADALDISESLKKVLYLGNYTNFNYGEIFPSNSEFVNYDNEVFCFKDEGLVRMKEDVSQCFYKEQRMNNFEKLANALREKGYDLDENFVDDCIDAANLSGLALDDEAEA